MKANLFLFTALFFSLPESSYSRELDLAGVLGLARKETDDMAIIRARTKASHEEVTSVKSAVWPELRFKTGATYHSSSNEPLKNLFGQGGAPPPFPDRFYGPQYNWNLNLRQPLITFGRLGVLMNIARSTVSLIDLQYELEQEQYFFQVIGSYLTAYMNFAAHEDASSRMSHLGEVTSFAKREYEMGALSKMDWLRIQARYQMTRADSISAYINLMGSTDRLKKLLGIPESEEITLVQNSTTENWMAGGSSKPAERKELEMQNLTKEITEYWGKYERANLLPAISLVGNMGGNNQEYYDTPDIDFGQAANFLKPAYYNYSLGLELNWTIFDGFKTTSTARMKKLEAKIEERKWNKLKKEIEISQAEADRKRKSADALVDASEKARDASRLALEQAKKDYQAGRLGITELLEIESTYQNSQLGYSRHFAGKILSEADYRISHGISLLEGLP